MFGRQDQDTRRAGARGLTRNNHAGLTRSLRRAAVGAVCAAAVTVPLIGAAGAQAATPAAPVYTPLTLVNGWTNFGSGTASAAVANISGIVHLKGAIQTSGNNAVAFTLPLADRPAARVYVPVDLCNAHNGRLNITPSGVASVQPEGSFADAQCFTLLDGVSFAKSAASFTPLTPVHGWVKYGSGTSGPAARNISGIVHLKGAIRTSASNTVAFTLPAVFRPATDVFVPVDMCNGTNGRLLITPGGSVIVDPEGPWTDAQCFTSLDGASYATSAGSFTNLTPVNGWAAYGSGTASPAARAISGIVHLEGAIQTSGNNTVAFTLPKAFRPAHNVFVKVDLCDAANGRLFITPSGSVSVDSEGPWSDAQCFTSLDGASYAR